MREGPAARIAWRFAQLLLAAPVLYLAAAFAVFDFSRPATAVDREYEDGSTVAYGPRPHAFLCRADYPDWMGDDYSGREWAFRVFRPVCRAWLRAQGYHRKAPK